MATKDEIINFSKLPEEFKYENIKSGDLYAENNISKNVYLKYILTLFAKSMLFHAGIFIWIDGNKYLENNQIKVIYNKINDASILCLLHQSFLGKINLNLLSNNYEYGYILEP